MIDQWSEKRDRLLAALPESARGLEIEFDPARNTPLHFRNKLLQPIRVVVPVLEGGCFGAHVAAAENIALVALVAYSERKHDQSN